MQTQAIIQFPKVASVTDYAKHAPVKKGIYQKRKFRQIPREGSNLATDNSSEVLINQWGYYAQLIIDG